MVGAAVTRHASIHGNARRRPDDAARRHPGRRFRVRRPPAAAGRPDPSEAPTTAGAAPTGGAADSSPDPGPRRLYKSRRRPHGRAASAPASPSTSPSTPSSCASSPSRSCSPAAPACSPTSPRGCSCPSATRGPPTGRGRTATIVGAVALVLAVCAVLPFGTAPSGAGTGAAPSCRSSSSGWRGWGSGTWLPGSIPPVGGARDVLRRAGFGLALLAVCGILALAGAWATAAGGGAVVAAVVIVAGLWLVAAAFVGGARWLILPALALALPAGVVSAANVDIDGGVGDRAVPPGHREPGARHVPPRRRAASSSTCATRSCPPATAACTSTLGVGQAVLVVPRDVCVTTAAHDRRRPGRPLRPRLGRRRRRLAGRAPRAAGHDAPRRRRRHRRRRARRHVRGSRPARHRPRPRSTTAAPATTPASGAHVGSRRPDVPSLVAGIAIVIFGAVLLLDRADVLTLRFAALGPLACAVARGDPARERSRPPRLSAAPGIMEAMTATRHAAHARPCCAATRTTGDRRRVRRARAPPRRRPAHRAGRVRRGGDRGRRGRRDLRARVGVRPGRRRAGAGRAAADRARHGRDRARRRAAGAERPA